MKKKILRKSAMIVMLTVSSAAMAWGPGSGSRSVFAQQGGPYGRRDLPISESRCWNKSYLETTPEQLRGLEGFQKSHFQEILALRKRQMDLRYELRALMDHRHPDSKTVLAKQIELSDLQKQADEISVRYYLKGRGLFTGEQISRLPSGCQLGFNHRPNRVGGPLRGQGWSRGRRF